MNIKKFTVIADVVIFTVIIAVFSVCFIPKRAITITGGKAYSAIYHGKRGSDKVALTFNVYEGTEIVNGILDVLKTRGAKGTFFVGGCWADDNAETLKRIISEGHELGNHGFFHKDHKKLTESGNYREITDAENAILAATGYKTVLFAPPSGSYSKATLKAACDLGYKTIMWTKDTIDWRDSDEKLIIKRAASGIAGGDIVLMHPKKHTLSALGKILDKITAAGLKAVTVSECCEF